MSSCVTRSSSSKLEELKQQLHREIEASVYTRFSQDGQESNLWGEFIDGMSQSFDLTEWPEGPSVTIAREVRRKARELLVDDAELDRRRAEWTPDLVPPEERRGYDRLYASEVLQADEGCDFAFLQPIGSKD